MRKFNAKQLHETPNRVYAAAHQEPVLIRHRSHGNMILLSESQIFSTHTYIDGSVSIHVRGLKLNVTPPDQDDAA